MEDFINHFPPYPINFKSSRNNQVKILLMCVRNKDKFSCRATTAPMTLENISRKAYRHTHNTGKYLLKAYNGIHHTSKSPLWKSIRENKVSFA